MTDDSEQVADLFSKNYPHCGKISKIWQPDSTASCSNTHYFIETSDELFFLKQLADPDALFQGDGSTRLDTVCHATAAFARGELPVEVIVPNATKQLLTDRNGVICRVYKAIDGRQTEDTVADLESAAFAIGEFHRNAVGLLDSFLLKKLKGLKAPYPLTETKNKYDQIKEFIRTYPNDAPFYVSYEALIEELNFLDKCLAKINNLDDNSALDQPVHLDFHPDNVLFLKSGKATIIDFDNMMCGPVIKCTAFSVLRFAWMKQKDQSLSRLDHVLNHWQSGYQGDQSSDWQSSVRDWMIYLEVEKVLRIVYRHWKTDAYGQFLENVTSRHIPNLKTLLNS